MYEGIFPLWKEKGMTSHDCVFKLTKNIKYETNWAYRHTRSKCRRSIANLYGQATKVAEYIRNQGKHMWQPFLLEHLLLPKMQTVKL